MTIWIIVLRFLLRRSADNCQVSQGLEGGGASRQAARVIKTGWRHGRVKSRTELLGVSSMAQFFWALHVFFSLPMLQELARRHGYVVSSVVCWMYFLSCACVVFVITWLWASFLETFGTSWPWISITCCSRKLSLSKLVDIDFNSPSSPWIWRNVKKTHWLKPVLVMDTLFQFVSNFL